MRFAFKPRPSRVEEPGLCVLFAFEGASPELPGTVRLPAVALRDFQGEFRETRACDPVAGGAKRVLLVGLGKEPQLDLERVRRVAALAVQRAEQMGCRTASLWVGEALEQHGLDLKDVGRSLAEGAVLGAYRWDGEKTKPKKTKLQSVTLVGRAGPLRDGAREGATLATANAYVRGLQNRAGNRLRPRDLAAEARKLAAKGQRVSCRVHDRAALKRMGAGLLLGVAAGSDEPPFLVHLTYRPRKRAKLRVALVGKGLTFDAGGLSIKPAAKMDEMRYDMSGAAAVLGVFHALSGMDLPLEIHGVVPTTENVINGSATKPGDIHTGLSGTTVEVLNTDAEGRLVLADALAYVREKVDPDVIVDLATLTGAVVVALGHELGGLFATSDELRDALLAAGQETGERLWPLPLLDHHKDQMKGVNADLRNIAPGDMGAGSSAGAAFLAHFVGDVEWAHLDIAGVAWGGANRDWVGGPLASGFGTRLLLRWLKGLA